ncbi:MAG: hypothetical protein A2W90_19165 [Bacteroidetes bacterium GWF2_42_66]|nr:MAG: hypothetical protein A2W92_05980 [Bacteroidetes bacterium GWA2_42_15]OFX98711.1 MAG: hypothetical protein A2W89_10525 [Bacteroidetes bacterium GWE2_42_39]OFY43090.1 MAG: hypothetical protein A2W90_19165 [Bacteroidetes bacterium GWF2_42_66]HBL77064.1 hypothetical protein [Prolixibacteraceae bacterium]HCU59882.1 hypothetical protein [Prolixibacteraceae bacterium]
MKQEINDQEVLLVKEKNESKLRAVKGFDENGKLQTELSNQANAANFLKIEKYGNPLENFFSNFHRQYQNPTEFRFFRVPADLTEKTAVVLEKMLQNPEVPSNKETLSKHEVKPEQYLQKEEKHGKATNLIDENKVDWSQLEKLGISKDFLKNTRNLEPMLNFQKSPDLIPITLKTDNITIHTDARLAFRQDEDGNFKVAVHAVRSKPELDRPYFGVTLTDEDKTNLLQTGNAGRILHPQYKEGETTPVFLSIDKLTNELVAARADKINIPEEIKGTKLNENQRKELAEGRAVFVEGMTARSGKEFSAWLQVDADKRGIGFRFEPRQEQNQNVTDQRPVRIPDSLLEKELTEEQKQKLERRETIYVTGMKDKEGQEFNAYVKINDEKGKLDFYKWNPDKAQSKGTEITPDNNSKTQVAVNSDGKTDEATKHLKEPLVREQVNPTEQQEERRSHSKAHSM